MFRTSPTQLRKRSAPSAPQLEPLESRTHLAAHAVFLRGPGLLAVFGAPVPGPRDATNAARCALDMLASIDRWNEHEHRSGDAAIRVAVGIHFGDVVQGDIGSEKQLELTVLGDTVNVASRVEGCCR